MAGYLERLNDAILLDTLTGRSAAIVVGPRGCGKTTTARRLANQAVNLGDPAEAFAFRADPVASLHQLSEPALLDGCQHIPTLVETVDQVLTHGRYTPNRFILTVDALPPIDTRWQDSDRLETVPMWPLTRRELEGGTRQIGFLDRIRDEAVDTFVSDDPATLTTYIEWALQSGFPDAALAATPDQARSWMDAYLDQLVGEDAATPGSIRGSATRRRYLTALARHSGTVVEHKQLYQQADVAATTARAYDRQFADLFITDDLPGWTTPELPRLLDTPRRYLVDGALMGALLDLTPGAVFADGDTMQGLLRTFVMAQLRPEASPSRYRPHLFHLRDKQARHHLDVVVEYADRQVAAIDITASVAPQPADFRHLRWLRDALGDRFVRGVLLYTGQVSVQVDDRIIAVPLSTIWA